jgi:hypothetical protein
MFLALMTIAAVTFASTVTWCKGQFWSLGTLGILSITMWSIKAPLYVPIWDPDCWFALALQLSC